MFSLTVCFGPTNMVWALLFKEKAKAFQYHLDISAAMNRDAPGTLIAEDDFGQSITIVLTDVHGIALEDLDQIEEARILRSLANARGEVKARQRAATDPVIRQAQQGPAVISPMGGQRFNG